MKKQNQLSIFLVEDDPLYASALQYDLKSESKYKIRVFPSGEDCLKNIKADPDIVLLDYFLKGDLNGIGVLKKIKQYKNDIEVIFLSGQEKIEVATNAMKYGAYDYVVKNESAFIRTKNVIKKIIRQTELIKENKESKMYKMLFFVSWAIILTAILLLGKSFR
ncbi:MAG: response regulator [Flavobacteriales bacterium]|nr:response regulator [Bacteroidales bacterium AH-315-I05]PCJ82145.1 MAG: response regulator [Flavobacteriales bacterium]